MKYRKALLFLSALFTVWVNYAFGQSAETVSMGSVRSYTITGNSNWVYHWTLRSPAGSLSNLTSTTTQSGNITFAEEGTYTLQAQATDTKGCLSEWVTKTIIVENIVQLLAAADAATTPMEAPVTIDVLANDIGVMVNTQVVVPLKSAHGGTITKNANGSVTYTPATGFWGSDSFTYQLCANGQTTGCSQAIVSISVKNSALNNVGVLAITDINNTWAGTTVSGNVLTNDLFYDPALVEAKVVTIPLAETGKLTFFDKKTGDYTFVPAAGFSGEAFFEYQICQKDETGKMVCSTSNVSIKVLGADSNNQAPVANSDVALTTFNTAIKGNFLQNDFIPGTGSYRISQVRNLGLSGTLKWDANGDFSYIPQNGFTGEEHFTYQICNDFGKCDWGTVSIYVLPSGLLQNDLYANYNAYFTTGQFTGNLSGSDFNSSASGLVYQVTAETGSAHGTVQVKLMAVSPISLRRVFLGKSPISLSLRFVRLQFRGTVLKKQFTLWVIFQKLFSLQVAKLQLDLVSRLHLMPVQVPGQVN